MSKTSAIHSAYTERPTLIGSGPVTGVVELNLQRPARVFVRKVIAEGGLRFVFNPQRLRLVAGTVSRVYALSGSPHQQLAQLIGATPGRYQGFLGGTVHLEFSGSGDTRQLQLLTDEGSPHLGHNWTIADRNRLAMLMHHVLYGFVQGEQQGGRGELHGANGEALGPVAGLRYVHNPGK